jgi:lipopolysaccharide biosynthesis glycosyltransferase
MGGWRDEFLPIYIGYDKKEDEAYNVACYSLKKNCSVPFSVYPLVQRQLRQQGLYYRGNDVKASTEFSLTRFLVPAIQQYKGWALFVDCDVIFLEDVAKLFKEADKQYALMCVHHDYVPKEGNKMFNQTNAVYPKKNFSSVMLFNCGHPANRKLNVSTVNQAEPSFLHQFKWLTNKQVGKLDKTWNFLAGEYEDPDVLPNLVHLTLGGPWIPDRPEHCKNKMFDELWIKYRDEMLALEKETTY